jgi:glutathionyl-hydroquinone reductase
MGGFVKPQKNSQMEKIEVNGEFLFELSSKTDWVNRVPRILPQKIRRGESWIWVDVNGNVFECGSDFIEADKHKTYPCKVYRLVSVATWSGRQG